MNALEQLRTTHRRVHAAEGLEVAARALCDVLTGDELTGEPLYDAIEVAVEALADALDSYEHPPADRLPPPPPLDQERGDDERLCALREVPISQCTCTACTARRSADLSATYAPKVTILPTSTANDLAAGTIRTAVVVTPDGMGEGHCPGTGKPAMSCTCDAHTAWRASGDAGDQDCRTCGNTVPLADYPRSGGGWSRDCRPCVAIRNGQNKSRSRRQREARDRKEPV